jgi:hypothetical protein
MKIGFITIAMFFIIVYASCNRATNSANDKQIKIASNIVDTIIKDIPDDKKRDYFMKIKRSIQENAELTSLEDGFDSLQIRIWYGYTSHFEHLVVLKNEQGKWDAILYSMHYIYSNRSLKEIIKYQKRVEPKSGWENLLNKLNTLKILSLPDMSTLEGYGIDMDSKGITVEIADKKMYRIYSYAFPEFHKNDHWQANNMDKISRIVEEELGFDRFKFPEFKKE